MFLYQKTRRLRPLKYIILNLINKLGELSLINRIPGPTPDGQDVLCRKIIVSTSTHGELHIIQILVTAGV